MGGYTDGMTASTTPTDVIMFLTEQHREVDDIFAQLEDMDGATDEKVQRLAEQVVTSLVKHSVAEEIYLYPAVRKALPDGDDVADHELHEHDEAEQTMKKLEGLTPEQAEFWPTLHQLIGEIRHHVGEEENNLFPKLRAACSEQELQELGRKVQRAEKFAPTRPHPSAPAEGAALGALAPGAGLVDRIRDALSGRGT
ncbi:MAG TPA: hemerythrin domain-containing protein [Pseudonocardiaceae bacterium]|nr:hemerythrin domain-containing protein [Pseudonocardiaceae bacterium]